MRSKLRFKVKAVPTDYWMPGDNYLDRIVNAVKHEIFDGDIIVISEKAISVAEGLIINEGEFKPGLLAYFIARFWMRLIWGYLLGKVCHLKMKNIARLRSYPLKEGAAHKEVALRYAGFLNSLMWGSEGGIDGSNLPYAYVSLPLPDPRGVAWRIRKYVWDKLGKKVAVMIVDTDKTYSLGSFHFTHRPNALEGIHNFLGFVAYVLGRALRLKRRSTPLALAGIRMSVDLALDVAEMANRARGSGAGYTVWDMAERFGAGLTGVTWKMLRRLKHKPIVIVRRVDAVSSPKGKNTGVSS